jgi:hypothetical protein
MFLILKKQQLTNTYRIVGECSVAAIVNESALSDPGGNVETIQSEDKKQWHHVKLPTHEIAERFRLSMAEHEARVLWDVFEGDLGVFLRGRVKTDTSSGKATQNKMDFSTAWRSFQEEKTNANQHKPADVKAGMIPNNSHGGNDIANKLSFFRKKEAKSLIQRFLDLNIIFAFLKPGARIWRGCQAMERELLVEEESRLGKGFSRQFWLPTIGPQVGLNGIPLISILLTACISPYSTDFLKGIASDDWITREISLRN